MSELHEMTDAELGELRKRVDEEDMARRCREFLPGHQSCDRGRAPHDEHGYVAPRYDGNGHVRVSWKSIPPEALPAPEAS